MLEKLSLLQRIFLASLSSYSCVDLFLCHVFYSICLSVFVPLPYCFCYYCIILNWLLYCFSPYSFCLGVLWMFWVFLGLYIHFRTVFSSSVKIALEFWWGLHWICTSFLVTWPFNDINSADLWTLAGFPYSGIFFNLFLQYSINFIVKKLISR